MGTILFRRRLTRRRLTISPVNGSKSSSYEMESLPSKCSDSWLFRLPDSHLLPNRLQETTYDHIRRLPIV